VCQWGEKMKILKIFIFWYFDFVERLYIITYGPDMFIARGPARGVYFFTCYMDPQSGGHLKQKSVNGLQIKMATTVSTFHIAIENKNWGVHARP